MILLRVVQPACGGERLLGTFKSGAVLETFNHGDSFRHHQAKLRDFEVGTMDEFPARQIRMNVLLLFLYAIVEGQLTYRIAEFAECLGCNLVGIIGHVFAKFRQHDRKCVFDTKRC